MGFGVFFSGLGEPSLGEEFVAASLLEAASSARARCSSVIPFVLLFARCTRGDGGGDVLLKLFPAVDGLAIDILG